MEILPHMAHCAKYAAPLSVEVYAVYLRNKMIEKDRREDIREALEKWQAAKKYFQNVSDPDLVDYAVFQEEAARRKYVLLLKRYAREQGD